MEWIVWLSLVLMAASIAFTAIALMRFFRPGKRLTGKGQTSEKTDYKPLRHRMLWAALWLLTAIWTLRFAVGISASIFTTKEEYGYVFEWYEDIFNSAIHALQTFSLDEDFANYIEVGRSVFGSIWSPLAVFYSVYAMILNVLAPIAGGAIIFDLLSEFLPNLKLWYLRKCGNRRFRYFSELNEKSIALAESMAEDGTVLVFTDAYSDNEEDASERISAAKALGAICIKDDLLHIELKHKNMKQVRICLIDESENGNLQALASLLGDKRELLKDSEIYVFASDKAYSVMDEEVATLVNRAQIGKDGAGAEVKLDAPTVIPVNGVRNMTKTLLMDVPLFESVIGKEPEKDEKGEIIPIPINVTILGSGVIGTEFFLTAYWCGQTLDHKLRITVVSKESRESFEGRIDSVNPDILKTANEESKLLKYTDDASNEPYFKFDYKETDVTSESFERMIGDSGIADSDCFIVALGSDEDNFAAADKLRRIVGRRHIFDKPYNKTVICYAIYNPELCSALNKECRYRYSEKTASDAFDVYMRAFGSLSEVYSEENVFFNSLSGSAEKIGRLYDEHKKGVDSEELKKQGEKRFKDIYSYQADLNRRFHRRYKEFSAGFHNISVFDAKDIKKECRDDPEKAYIKYINEGTEAAAGRPKLQLMHELAWLEHRRWCAFMRVMGFRSPELRGSEKNDEVKEGEYVYRYRSYYSLITPEHAEPNHKFISLKLHPCIVECGKQGMNAKFDDFGHEITDPESEFTDAVKGYQNDYLDKLSLDRRGELDKDSEDFKKWDYPDKEDL